MNRDVAEDQHGTVTGYTYGCRCQDCRNARLWAQRALKKRGELTNPDDPRHGTASGYTAHRCRCDECATAWASYHSERYVPEPEAGTVTIAEVRMWAQGLGFRVNNNMTGRAAEALIARWNRENPDRPYARSRS